MESGEVDRLSELSTYLESLRQAGSQQGESGDFTVDPFKGQRKLEAFQLAKPELCLLPLVSACVANKATVIDVQGDFTDLSIRFDGRIWTHLDFAELLTSDSKVAREFRAAFSAAQALDPEKVTLLSRSGTLVSVLEFDDLKPTLSHYQDDPVHSEDFNWLEVRGGKAPGDPKLYDLLTERCCYCPQVAYRGRRLIRSSPPSTAARLEIRSPNLSQPSLVMSAWVCIRTEMEGCAGHLWMTGENDNLFTFLVNGVAYNKRVKLGPYKGVRAVVALSQSRLDLSRTGLVTDDTFHQHLKTLEQCISQKLMPRVKREIRGMMPAQRKIAERFLEQWKRAGRFKPLRS